MLDHPNEFCLATSDRLAREQWSAEQAFAEFSGREVIDRRDDQRLDGIGNRHNAERAARRAFIEKRKPEFTGR